MEGVEGLVVSDRGKSTYKIARSKADELLGDLKKVCSGS